MSQAQATYFH